MRANSATEVGLELSSTLYSVPPTRAWPAGTITFDAWSAATTSAGDSPFAASAWGSISMLTCRAFPPNGAGVDSPGIVNSRTRMKFSP